MADLMRETRKLSKQFKEFTAVDAVDLQVRQGHIHALIGPNGAGKTTCFNLLTRFLAPSSGQMLFKGRDISRVPPARVARMGMVRSFQISAVFPHMSVLENVRIGLQRRLGTSSTSGAAPPRCRCWMGARASCWTRSAWAPLPTR